MLPELPGSYLVAPGTVLVDPGSTADRTWSCLVPGTRVPARRDACLIATLAGSPSAHSRHSPCASFRYLAVQACVRNISPLPPRCWFICRRREKDDVPRDRHRRNAKTATGLPVGLHAEHMCITRRLRLGITRRSFGCGLYSHEPSLTAHGVSSNEVVCHATELVARPRYRSRRWALLSRLPSPGHALEGNKILQHRSCQWPGLAPGRLVPGW